MQSLQHIISSKFLSGTHFPEDDPNHLLNIIVDEFSLPYVEDHPRYRKVLDGWCEHQKPTDMLRSMCKIPPQLLMIAALRLRNTRMINILLDSITDYGNYGQDMTEEAVLMENARILEIVLVRCPRYVVHSLIDNWIKGGARTDIVKILYDQGADTEAYEGALLGTGNISFVLAYDEEIR
jgi:hypothetical protein